MSLNHSQKKDFVKAYFLNFKYYLLGLFVIDIIITTSLLLYLYISFFNKKVWLCSAKFGYYRVTLQINYITNLKNNKRLTQNLFVNSLKKIENIFFLFIFYDIILDSRVLGGGDNEKYK